MTWTANEFQHKQRAVNQMVLLLKLHRLQQAGELDLSNKSALARSLGISRHTLDRNLHILAEAQKLVKN